MRMVVIEQSTSVHEGVRVTLKTRQDHGCYGNTNRNPKDISFPNKVAAVERNVSHFGTIAVPIHGGVVKSVSPTSRIYKPAPPVPFASSQSPRFVPACDYHGTEATHITPPPSVGAPSPARASRKQPTRRQQAIMRLRQGYSTWPFNLA